MRLIKSHQGILRNIYSISGVAFLLSVGVYVAQSGIVVLSQVSASNAAIVLGVVWVASLLGGIIEFD